MPERPLKMVFDKTNIFSFIGFPENAFLGKRMAKKLFLENTSMPVNDRKLFQKNTKSIYWQYTLKPSTCQVLPFKDHEREYHEIAVLSVELDIKEKHKRIAEIIHRAIPYPLMLGFFTEGSELALSIAPKRFSHAEQGAFVAERFFTTEWLNMDTLENREMAFFESLSFHNLPLSNYGALYNAWVDRFTGYECSVFSGTFNIGKDSDRLEALNQCREIESKISDLRAELKKVAFNRQVEINIEIKKKENELKKMVKSL